MFIETEAKPSLAFLQAKATQLRIDSIRSTTEAASGHPTSCVSAAEIMAVLFFAVMRYDPKDPHNPDNDIFVLSKGHAAPILYAAWAEAGLFPRDELLRLRKITSDFEGHPTPRLPFVDVATGSLGQGLSVATGIAVSTQLLRHTDQRVYVLMGDGESAEGSIWEAAQTASLRGLSNLCATVDINRLGQSEPTMLQHHLDIYRQRWEAFGWQALTVDGHDIAGLQQAYERAAENRDRPTVVLARTLKGKGLPSIEDKENHHGKPLKPDEAQEAIKALEWQLRKTNGEWRPNLPPKRSQTALNVDTGIFPPRSPYEIGQKEIATRRAFGDALAGLGKNDARIVVLDGDVKNSTYTEEFQRIAPDRFFQCYIAEQNMVGMAMGLAARGRIPFVATFACFLTRAYDFVRMVAISHLNIKLAGTHAGVSIGEDGPSQMGLEDLAMMTAQPDITVLYPADATSAWHATYLLACHKGPSYLRLARGASPVLYGSQETFEIGKCKVLRHSDHDRLLIVAAGVTVFEALKAFETLRKDGIAVRVIDLFSVRPIDRDGLSAAVSAAGGIVITVEDHYRHGGLGDAVADALSKAGVEIHKMAVEEIPRSGRPAELLQKYGISADAIVARAKAVLEEHRVTLPH
jgi:transketolase